MDLIQSPESFQVDRQIPSSSTYQCYVVQWSLVVMAVCDICDLCYWIEVLPLEPTSISKQYLFILPMVFQCLILQATLSVHVYAYIKVELWKVL